MASKAKNVFPSGMLPMLPFFQGVEIYGEVSPKMDSDGVQKVTSDGIPQWVISVIVPMGRLSTEQRVTVVNSTTPDISDGDKVQFVDLHVGSYSTGASSGLYLWATTIQKIGGDS